MKTIAMSTAVTAILLSASACLAYDTSGPHAFFNDDRSQFIDVWLNSGGNVTFKVSNGRPWRPMWVVAHVLFMSGKTVLTTKDYHVYCPSPNPGQHGQEAWFVFQGPALAGVSEIAATTNKEDPWKSVPGDQPVTISISTTMP